MEETLVKKLLSILLLLALMLPIAAFSEAKQYEYKEVDGYKLVVLPEDSAPVTITMMGWEGGPSETDNIYNALDTFKAFYPHITVEYTPGDYDTHHSKLMTMIAGGAGPDVFYCGPNFYAGFARRNMLYDITELYNQVYTLDDYIPAALEQMMYGDQMYGISSCTTSPVLYYNKDLFDEAGVAYPSSNPEEAWTWDEFVEAAKQLTKTNDAGDVTQFGLFGLEDPALSTAFLNQYDVWLLNEEGTELTGAADPNFKVAYETVKALRTEHGVEPRHTFIENVGMNNVQMLLTGRVAMFVEGSWAGQEVHESGVNFGVAPLPVMDGAKSATWAQAHMHSINANTKNIDEAWALLVFLGSENYQIDMIKVGLWMPNRTSLYTEEGIQRWLSDAHPEGFAELSTYWRDSARLRQYAYLGNEGTAILRELTQAYYADDITVDQFAEQLTQRVNAMLAEAN